MNNDNRPRENLASLIDLDPTADRIWATDELAALFHHQLSATAKIAPGTEAATRTVGELLADPNPAVEQLVELKDFAKANASHHDSVLPSDLAKVLYYLAIAAALVRTGRRITSMSDPELATSLRWAGSQPFVTEPFRRLLADAQAAITAS
jgi:hypothetical protein